jgi:hypothetical protein
MTGAIVGHSLPIPIAGPLIGHAAGEAIQSRSIDPGRKSTEALKKAGFMPKSAQTRLEIAQQMRQSQAVPKAKAGALPAEQTGAMDQLERASKLSPEDKKVEEAAFKHVQANERAILDANREKYGNIVNTDNFRPAFKEQGYAGHNAAAVQEPASYLSKKARTEALKNPGVDAITFAGGSGTGKTSAIKGIPELKDQASVASVVMDGNLSSLSSAAKWLDEARAAGKNTPIWYVYRDPVDAFENGVVKRMLKNKEEGGRLVPSKVIAGNHIGSWEVVQQLRKQGYNVVTIDNSLGANNARVIPFEEMQQKIKYPSEKKLTDIFNQKAKELLDNGTISQKQYEGYIQWPSWFFSWHFCLNCLQTLLTSHPTGLCLLV